MSPSPLPVPTGPEARTPTRARGLPGHRCARRTGLVGRRRRCALGVALIGLALLAPAYGSAAPSPAPLPVVHASEHNAAEADRVDRMKEYGVKAGFLANFVKYSKWPKESFKSKSAPFIVLVVGRNQYATVIERALEGRSFGSHPIIVRQSHAVPAEVDAHLVFATQLAADAAAQLLQRCAGRNILIVGEETGYAQAGAGLNFYLAGGKVRFEANPDALRRAGLQVSSELLKLARIVKEDRR